MAFRPLLNLPQIFLGFVSLLLINLIRLNPIYAQALDVNLKTQLITQINPAFPPEPSKPPLLPSPLPPPEDLLQPPVSPTPPKESFSIPGKIFVKDFKFEGNTAFSDAELKRLLKPYTQRRITFVELLQARSAITQYYVDQGYITTGAFIPEQKIQDGVVLIKILEGSISEIQVTVQGRLNPNYVRDRLAIKSGKPLNINRLLDALRLLQINPLIQRISAQLEVGTRPGTNILTVEVETANTFNADAIFDNGRSPSVGELRRGVQVEEANLLGIGDRISGWYLNTNGSHDWNISYTIPINVYNGSFKFDYRNVASRVVEDPFDELNLESDYQKYSFALRQPILETASQTLALALVFEHQKSQTSFLDNEPLLGVGADQHGRTNISTLRFSQEWIDRSNVEVISLLSEFSFGFDAFGTTDPFDFKVNPNAPNSNYFIWRGQAQWVRLLAPDFLLYVHGDLQLADGPLVPLEQFGLGGLDSVRGYRQNFLLGDNGFYTTVELRIPIYRTSSSDNVLQIVPFADVGRIWNSFNLPNPEPQTLASVGLGLHWTFKDLIKARIDWGIPLIQVNSDGNTLQDYGITFSIIISPF
ncbi:ShlB/FhaC/HecB family hemolysin secretion/activation protein [Chroococcus sp. FPU101]|uniref:ShlB/FhaC/HecB family hemolysin secretion/activation protein n=1 Tax=Chroococcus sp. FPU101 TaxID=1974212 RepID=UPI001A8F09C4|nr:ShlB/FhaC/HecB family hemolysin secretion/activation protein [Chroococcus sp. FPU101]GFE72175.1 ShlB-type polypeptide-transport-associated domain protein [Chroococcus sp. FPU101]